MTRYYLSRVLTILFAFLALRASLYTAVDGAPLLMLPLWLALSFAAYCAAPSLPELEPEVAE